jgi:putative membrane protein
MFFAPIMVIAVLATVVIVVVLVVRWLGGGFSPGNVPSLPPHSRHKTALEIFEERFAKGEIENDEFEEKKRICDSP